MSHKGIEGNLEKIKVVLNMPFLKSVKDVDAQFCSGYCVFIFWVSGPFATSFEFGSRTLSVSFYRVFESCCLVIYFVSNGYLSLSIMSCHFVSCLVFRIYFRQMSFNCFVINHVV